MTSLTYSFVLLVIALEMADVETPSGLLLPRGFHNPVPIDTLSALKKKMNDLIVSPQAETRWHELVQVWLSILASIEVLKRNREWAKWFEEGDMEFKLAA